MVRSIARNREPLAFAQDAKAMLHVLAETERGG